MIWRELVLVKNGQVPTAQHSHPFVPDLQKIKYLTSKGTKKIKLYNALYNSKSFY